LFCECITEMDDIPACGSASSGRALHLVTIDVLHPSSCGAARRVCISSASSQTQRGDSADEVGA
jgi:hypothetical protein